MFENLNDSKTNDDEVFRTYKVKRYKNSDGDAFGFTIKGRGNNYLQAHGKLKII